MPNYSAAAVRHYQDAEFLENHQRYPTADHLSGFAAECILKAILVGFFGGRMSSQGKPWTQAKGQKRVEYGHLPDLWAQIALLVSGRSAARFIALMSTTNPFLNWRVSDRYDDGIAINALRVQGHLTAARTLLALHQKAVIDGIMR
jgi:hypothetical protein